MLIILSGLLFFQSLGSIALWDPDEPRQAVMAREMADRHDYIHPYLNGKPYLEKPPFYSWMIIVASKVTGSLNEFASRVPSALAATALVFATFLVGTVLLDSWAGFLAAVILATNYQFLSNARESVMDMTFASFMGLTIVFAYLALRRDKRWYFVLAFFPSALAILTKGPAGLVLPAGIIFIYMMVNKQTKRYFLPLVLGCLLSGAIASIWFLLAGDAYIKEFILRQNVTRYTNAFDHLESFTYYFHKLFLNFLPWSIFLPFATYHAAKRKYWLPFIWFAFIFLFFEFSTSKRAIYLLSCYPACALLTGFYIRDKWSSLADRAVTGSLLRIFALILTLLPIAAVVALFTVSNQTVAAFRDGPRALYVYVAIMVMAGGSFFFMLFRKSERNALISLIVYLTTAGVFYGAYYMPLMDRTFKSPRLLTDPLKGRLATADVYTYGFSSAGIIYYAGKPIQTFMDIKKIKDDKSDILLIIEDGPSRHLQKDLDARFTPVGKARYEKEYYTFYVRKNGR